MTVITTLRLDTSFCLVQNLGCVRNKQNPVYHFKMVVIFYMYCNILLSICFLNTLLVLKPNHTIRNLVMKYSYDILGTL